MWRFFTAQLCACFLKYHHIRGRLIVFLLRGWFWSCVQCCPLKNPITTRHHQNQHILISCPASSHSLERILGGFMGRTVSTTVWSIEHGLVLRWPFIWYIWWWCAITVPSLNLPDVSNSWSKLYPWILDSCLLKTNVCQRQLLCLLGSLAYPCSSGSPLCMRAWLGSPPVFGSSCNLI